MTWKIPLFKIYWDNQDLEAVLSVITSGVEWAVGPRVIEFEKALADFIGTKYAAVFNSGTSALHAAFLAHKIREGDEVIVPSFTFIATANAPLFVGAKPIFADIEEETLGLDPEDVKRKITQKTKAIIAVHYAGCPCKIRELREIADDYKMLLIEDAAEAFGAKIFGKKVGTFGDSSIFSFCQNKIITTGEGGAVLTNSKEIYERLKLIRSHGRLEAQEYFSSSSSGEYITLGYNFRLSNILASLGISQLKKVDKIIEMRREIALKMTEKLSKINVIKPPIPPKGYFHVYQMYTIRTPWNIRNSLLKYLASKGIMTKIYFEPLHLTKFYKELFGYKDSQLPVTEKVSKEVLTLPLYPTLTDNEINYISNNVIEFVRLKRGM